MVTLICERCGKPFDVHEHRKDSARFCSKACIKNQVTKVCFTCGKNFDVKASHAHGTFCCSLKCGNERKIRIRQIEIEEQFGEPIYTLLTRLYHLEQLGIKRIAKILGVSDRNLWDWFEDLGIERRHRSDAVALQWQHNDERRKQNSELMKTLMDNGVIDNHGDNNPAKQTQARAKIRESKLGERNPMYGRYGELNPAWTGGKVYYYGANWDEQRDKARRRDNYACQRCGITEDDYGRQLDVHHIVKFRMYGLDRFQEANHIDNLICLCTACHRIVEGDSLERIHDEVQPSLPHGLTAVQPKVPAD